MLALIELLSSIQILLVWFFNQLGIPWVSLRTGMLPCMVRLLNWSVILVSSLHLKVRLLLLLWAIIHGWSSSYVVVSLILMCVSGSFLNIVIVIIILLVVTSLLYDRSIRPTIDVFLIGKVFFRCLLPGNFSSDFWNGHRAKVSILVT